MSLDHETLIRREFARQADAMATAALFNDEGVLARIRDAARLTVGSRVLDVACGPGIVVEALARAAGEVVGCDITPQMLEKTRARCAIAGLANVRMLPKSELHQALTRAGLRVESCVQWTNHREFEEWLKITSAPERAAPLKVMMSALALSGAKAGIGLRLEGEKILFDHTAALTVAVKEHGRAGSITPCVCGNAKKTGKRSGPCPTQTIDAGTHPFWGNPGFRPGRAR